MQQHSKPFRFSVQAFAPASPDDFVDNVRAAEDLGYSCFHVSDHYLGPGAAAKAANHPPQVLAAIPAMSFAAALTSTIGIGARVMCLDFHHPVVLAKSLATIDYLSGGRLEAGFGAGWIASEYEAMGLSMDRPSVRIDRMAEYVELTRAYVAGDDLDIAGDHVRVSGMRGLPTSPQEGAPKIMIGGGSPKVLRTAGRLADIVSINFDNSAGEIGARSIESSTADATMAKIRWIEEGAGDRFAELELEIGAYYTAVTPSTADTADALGRIARHFDMPTAVLASLPHTLVGTVDEICDTLEERREQYGISYVSIPERSVRAFAPVVERLGGR